jgi:hypothetical protein
MSTLIEVRDPDDEIVACGVHAHIERMDRDRLWIGLTASDGSAADIGVSIRGGRLTLDVDRHQEPVR